MVGRKANLKFLVSKLHEVGVSVVKTTEFVQGHTARWGLAWSFLTPAKKFIALQTPKRSHNSFMLEVCLQLSCMLLFIMCYRFAHVFCTIEGYLIS